MIELGAVLLEQQLDYLDMPSTCGPQKRRSTIVRILNVKFDAGLLEQQLDHLSMSSICGP